MSAKGYTTEEAIENYIGSEIAESLDDQIDEWISAVEQIIDKYTGRNFIADAEATARVFDGDGSQVLLVDECIEITKVEQGQDGYGSSFSEVEDSGADRYFLEPANYEVKELPIYKIILNARRWPEGIQNNRVTAKWGFSAEVPDDIKFVATVFVAGIYNEERGGSGDIKRERIGNYDVTYDVEGGGNSWADFERAKNVLDAYKRLNI